MWGDAGFPVVFRRYIGRRLSLSEAPVFFRVPSISCGLAGKRVGFHGDAAHSRTGPALTPNFIG